MSLHSFIGRLQQGETVQFRPRGNSMAPRIESGNLVTVVPVQNCAVEKGDVVLCKVRGRVYLHLVTAKKDDQFQIGNNHGRVNGWTNAASIYGKLVRVEP